MTSINLIRTVAGLIAALLLTQPGCAESRQEPTTDNATASPVVDGGVRGTVLETMNSGGYSYVLVETEQDRRWLAVPQTVVQVGDTIQASQGMPMPDFESKSLNRSFDIVYFLGGLENLSAPAVPENRSTGALPSGHPSIDGSSEIPPADIDVAELKSGQNIAYVHANKSTLAGQQISLRGEVVKYNANILGWNFIHIQDGSGDVADGSNDLTVTSKAATVVGETLVVTGTIILNKDFGYGYTFPVMMEGASLTASDEPDDAI